ncbi:hypothetical protein Agub_g14750, partial [Astrephomene gubernaculifera]
LLAQLGLRLDQQLEEMQRQGVPPEILARWLRTERQRSARSWRPLRPPCPASADGEQEQEAGGAGGGGAAAAGGEAMQEEQQQGEGPHDPQAVVLLEEIRDGLFP